MAKKIKEKKESFSPLTIILLIILILYCISFFYLLLWGVSASLKIDSNFFEWQQDKLFSNYGKFDDHLMGMKAAREAEYLQLKELYDTLGRDMGRDKYNQMLLLKDEVYGKFDSNGILIDPSPWDTALTKYSSQKQEMKVFLPFYAYKNVFQEYEIMITKTREVVGMWEMYGNSIMYAGGCALAATFVPCITAYACARFNYKFSRIIHTTVIVVMMIPIVGSMPSEIKIAQATGVYDKFYGLWVMRANFLGLYFLVFYDICKALPTSFSEAAKMDGANNFQIFFKIAMPLIKNTFFTILLIRFIEFWNEYQAPMVYTPSFPTIALGLNNMMGKNSDSIKFDTTMIPSRMAAAVLTAAPVCILFACFQKRLLGNLTMGGVKG